MVQYVHTAWSCTGFRQREGGYFPQFHNVGRRQTWACSGGSASQLCQWLTIHLLFSGRGIHVLDRWLERGSGVNEHSNKCVMCWCWLLMVEEMTILNGAIMLIQPRLSHCCCYNQRFFLYTTTASNGEFLKTCPCGHIAHMNHLPNSTGLLCQCAKDLYRKIV